MEFILILIRKYFAKKRWRKCNSHNHTFLRNIADFNCVEVGKGTYGPIDVQMSRHDVKLKIGNYCSIGGNVIWMLSSDHPLDLISTYPFSTLVMGEQDDAVSKGDIVVGDDVWIGYGAIIMSGVHIGQGAVIGAGSIVTNDLPPYSIAAGIPAKVIRYRFKEEIVKELLKIDYGRLSEKQIKQHILELKKRLTDIKQLEWLIEENVH